MLIYAFISVCVCVCVIIILKGFLTLLFLTSSFEITHELRLHYKGRKKKVISKGKGE